MPLAWIERPLGVVAGRGELDGGIAGSGRTVWTEPLPKVWVPMMTARLWSCSAPATISEAEAEPLIDQHHHRHLLDFGGQRLEVVVLAAPQVVRGAGEFLLGILGAAVGRHHLGVAGRKAAETPIGMLSRPPGSLRRSRTRP